MTEGQTEGMNSREEGYAQGNEAPGVAAQGSPSQGGERVKSRREAHLERLRKKYPDRNFEDDEEVFSATGDDYDEYEKTLEGYKEQSKSLTDMFAADPRSAQFLADMHNGTDPVVGLVRHFGLEIKDVLDDPQMQEKIAEANREYVERVAKSRELDEEYERNLQESINVLKEFQQERGMTDEEADTVLGAMLDIVRDGVMGKFAKETLEMVSKAMRYDADVAAAGAEGEIAGRNARIVEQYRRAGKGDGVAPLGGKNGDGSIRKDEPDMFDLANEAMY